MNSFQGFELSVMSSRVLLHHMKADWMTRFRVANPLLQSKEVISHHHSSLEFMRCQPKTFEQNVNGCSLQDNTRPICFQSFLPMKRVETSSKAHSQWTGISHKLQPSIDFQICSLTPETAQQYLIKHQLLVLCCYNCQITLSPDAPIFFSESDH